MKTQRKGKNLFKLLVSFILIGVMVACVEEDLGRFDPKEPNMTLGNSDTILVAKDTATYTVNIESNLPWRIKSDADWIVLKTQSGLESGQASFFVTRNQSQDVRITKLIAWITDEYQKVIIIKQEAGDPPPDTSHHYYVKVDGNATNDGKSWENPTTLGNALELALSNDFIHIAAGTYSPESAVTGGSASEPGDKTFEIKNNINIIGGYPANAVTGAIADAANNTTTLSGVVQGGNSYHVVTVTAPLEDGRKVSVKDINITGGKSGTGVSAININGLSYQRINGGAMIIGRSVVEFTGCRIYENQALQHTPGVYIFANANVTFNDCSIDNNKGVSASGGNAGGMWNDGSTVYIINSSVSNNENSGVAGGIYAFNSAIPSKTYIYNSIVSSNKSSHKAGIYGRENSETVLINSTVFGNETKSATTGGAGVSVYANATSTKLDMISCTVTNNNSVGTSHSGSGGMYINDANCTVNISNSIISGNFSNGAPGDIYKPAAVNYSKVYSIIGDKVHDASGAEVAGQIFDYTTMLAPLANNGGATYTCLLQGANNPAITLGMNAAQLTTLGASLTPSVSASIMQFDQIGNSREGKNMMGSCVKQ